MLALALFACGLSRSHAAVAHVGVRPAVSRGAHAARGPLPSDRPPRSSLVAMRDEETPLPPARDAPPPPRDAPPPGEPDLFVPALVAVSFGGYALIVLYDIFFGNGLCGLTVQCATSPWG
mmetsp:Transcript_24147/g.42525  ORF Transcript_24147/g.42525 Transcript_24147/m.42525 type:complete len:120 (-) Transcript_24147:222-581(-)